MVWQAFLFQSRIFGVLIDSEAFSAFTAKGISAIFSPVNSIHSVAYFHNELIILQQYMVLVGLERGL